MKEPPKSAPMQRISSLLEPKHRDLQTVLSKVKALKALDEIMQSILPENVKKFCQVGNLSNGVLILLAANSAVATQLRYEVPGLLKQLHGSRALRHIKEIQLKVRPPVVVDVERGAVDKPKNKVNRLTDETAMTWRLMAESIEDEELREAMLRIAEHTSKG